MNIVRLRSIVALALAATSFACQAGRLTPDFLRCEYRVDPLGIDETAPRLSWLVNSSRRGDLQTACQILVASSESILARESGDLWDSGRSEDGDPIGVVYQGRPLASGEFCYWKVRVWDMDAQPSAWSKPAVWSMGLLQQEDWRGDWIGYDKMRMEMPVPTNLGDVKGIRQLYLPPPSYLRKEFMVSKRVRRAMLYATALGLVDLHLNGRLVSEDRFTPGWTDYTKRVLYRAYDVTKWVRRGKNALGAILADGWYSGYIGWGQVRDHYGTKPRFRGQLQIDYADGSSEIVASGPDWKASAGPIREADFLMGESFDARLDFAHKWDDAGFNDSLWEPVVTGAEMTPLIQAHPGPPVRVFAEIAPTCITQPSPGVYVFDMGQNFAGVARLTISGQRGQKITLRFAERLQPDGNIYTVNLRGARATDAYICRGHGTEIWEPRFTYHGFQYVEVRGLTRPPSASTITGLALSSATTDAGSFACSDPMLNRLARNIYWTQRANFIDIPTDCPQRDERLGWMGDAQVYLRAATLHEDVQSFFTKWLVDVQDGQRADGQYPMVAPVKVAGSDGGPAWADAGVICPWTIYQVYGDKRVLERHYDSMARFIDFCQNRSTPDLLPPKEFHCFGDWLNIKEETPHTVIYTAYFAHSTHLLAQIAEALGRTNDAVKYNYLFRRIKAAFNHAYVAGDGRIEGNTQTDYALALSFGLLDEARQKRAAQYLLEDIEKHDWHLATGFIGTKYLMLTLAQIGRNDVAQRLIHNDTFPSWGFSIKQGATSIWERWDGWTPQKGFQDPVMNSFAHYAFGAVYQWMVENIGGIRSDGPDYKRIIIAPQIDHRLTFADTTYAGIRGRIETHWLKKGHGLRLKVVIPANTTATVSVPGAATRSVYESGRWASHSPGVTFVRIEGDAAVFEVGSGKYDFVTK
jgi:alpha-L-rhamnosidase